MEERPTTPVGPEVVTTSDQPVVSQSARLAFSTRYVEDDEAVLKLAALPAALAKELRFMDSNGNGTIDVYELRKLAKLYKADALSLRRAIAIAAGFALLLVITLFSMFGLTTWAVALQKDMRVSSSHALTALDGSVLRTASEAFSISAAGELIQYPASSDGEAPDDGGASPLVSLAIATSTASLTPAMSDEQLFALKSVALSAAGKTLSLDVVGAFRDADGSFAIATHLGSLRVRGEGIFFMEEGLSPVIHELGFVMDQPSGQVNGARARRLTTSTTANATTATTAAKCVNPPYYDNNKKQCCAGAYIAFINRIYQCTNCPAGRWKEGWNTRNSCTVCPAGSYCPGGSPYGATYPTPCAAGTYSNASASVCARCPSGTATLATGANSSAYCLPCPSGFYETGNTCAPCAAGTYSLKGNTTCTQCQTDPFYEWSEAGSSACNQCPAGSYITFAKNYTYTVDSATLSSWYGASTSSSVSVSLPDVSSGAAGCAACPAGTFNGYRGAAACESCPLGTFSNRTGATNESTCTPCTYPNVTLAPGSATCVGCPFGSLPLSDLTGCYGCPAGQFFYGYGNSSASLSDSLTSATLSCANCTAGRFSPRSGALECLTSPAGFIAPYDMNVEALGCPIATFSGSGSVNCTPCDWGYVAAQNSAACAPCRPGSRALSDMSACTSCDPGSFSNASTNTECLLAPPGYYVPRANATSAAPCWAGSYAPSDGETRCTACPAGTFSASGSSFCTECDSGSWSAANASSCSVAPPGFYVPDTLDSVLPCAPGTFADVSGASNCTVCPVGSFLRALTASTRCTVCPLNTFAPSAPYTNITACLSW